MKKFFAMFLKHWAKTPLKIGMTLFAVALGTGILILSFSISSILQHEISDTLEANGAIFYVANGSWNESDTGIDQTRPTEWEIGDLDVIRQTLPTVSGLAIVQQVPFDTITTQGTSYSLRSSIGTSPEYFDIFDLELVAGVPMQEDDVALSLKKVWISSELAVALYGSTEAATGAWIQPPATMLNRGMGERNSTNTMITQYQVAGVFASPTEIFRRSYGIGDMLLPYTALLPGGANIQMMKDMMSGTFVIRSSEQSPLKIDSAIRQLLSQDGEIDLVVWEGTPYGISTYREELRQAVNIFSISVTILGLVLLLTSSLGIFSIMVVETLSRSHDIALERALGASQGTVITEFWSWSLALSSIGALLGIGLAYLLSDTVMGTLIPLIGEVSTELTGVAKIHIPALILGTALTLACGGILGLLPAIPVVRGNISETLREV